MHYKVPPVEKFDNWRSQPLLVTHDQRLRNMGLKDPWIRNVAWIYRPEVHGQGGKTFPVILWNLFKIGLRPGLLAAAAFIAVEESYQYVYYGKTSWTSHHGHHDDHHLAHQENAHGME